MSEILCREGTHRWDAQIALAKGGVEDGDLCSCGQRRFGADRTEALAKLIYETEEELRAREDQEPGVWVP